MKRIRFWLLSGLSLFVSGTSLLTAAPLKAAPQMAAPLNFAATHYPPFTIVPEIGPVQGLSTEIVTAAFARQGIEIKVSTPPWARALKSVQFGKMAGLISCTRNEQRDDYLLYSMPINEVHIGLTAKKETPLPATSSAQDLAKLKLIAIRKWSSQSELESRNIPHTTVESIPQALDMLIMRDFDAIYSGTESVSYYARKADIAPQLKHTPLADRPAQTLHMCLSKNVPDAGITMQRFNQGLADIIASGEYASIMRKYLGEPSE